MSSSKVLPRRLSFSKICDILVAYLNAGANKEYVSVSEAAEKANVTLHNISRNNSFLKSWGFIEESEKEQGKYKLTREAAEFAYAYRIDPNGKLTRQMLRNILSKDETLTKFIERVRNEEMDRDSILLELPRLIGDLRADKVGLNAFLDLIAYAFQLDWLYMPAKIVKPSTRKTAPVETRVVKYSAKKPRDMAQLMYGIIPESRTSIAINLTITPDITPSMLKEYVKAILKAYDEYKQESFEEETN